MSSRAPAIGIDLGNSYSCVGVFRNNKVEIIANEHGNRITPSYVAFTDTKRFIGDSAKNQIASNSENTLFGMFVVETVNLVSLLFFEVCVSFQMRSG